MPFDESLAQRIRDVLSDTSNVVERKMMGGLIFMVNQHMCCGVTGDSAMVRVGADAYDDALSQEHVEPLDIGGGRQPKAFIVVAPDGIRTRRNLHKWIARGLTFVDTLPAKKKRPTKQS